MSERWKPVVGFEKYYEVSSLGLVRSLPRRGTRGKVLTPFLAGPKTGKRWTVDLSVGDVKHRLVLEAHVGPAPEDKPLGLHGPLGPDDNGTENVYWGSFEQNNGPDKQRDGTQN